MSVSRWADALRSQIEQGDVYSVTFRALGSFPTAPLEKQTIKKHGEVWLSSKDLRFDAGGRANCLGSGRSAPVLVVSHGCSIDKPNRKTIVQVAALVPMSNLEKSGIDIVKNRRNRQYFPVHECPGLPDDHYVDLRTIGPLTFPQLSDCTRLASMTDDGIGELQAHLVAYYTRKDLTAELRPGVEA